MRMLPAVSVPMASGAKPAASAAAGPPLDPPGTSARSQGVARGPVHRAVSGDPPGELVRSGLAEDDPARGPDPSDNRGVGTRAVTGEHARAAGGRQIRCVEKVLDYDGNAVERPSCSLAVVPPARLGQAERGPGIGGGECSYPLVSNADRSARSAIISTGSSSPHAYSVRSRVADSCQESLRTDCQADRYRWGR